MESRLRAAVAASLRWYEDVFAVHGIPTAVERGVWRSFGHPPRWHSAAKTTEPTAAVEDVLRATEPFRHCSIADSFGVLDLSDAGFELVIEASWVHRAPPAVRTGVLPRGWSVIDEEEELDAWNRAHDTLGVLVPPLLSHPRFHLLCEKADGRLLGGAVLHDGGQAAEVSNQWAVAGHTIAPDALLACAGVLHPGRAVVGYDRGASLEALLDAGFEAVGPQHVWAR